MASCPSPRGAAARLQAPQFLQRARHLLHRLDRQRGLSPRQASLAQHALPRPRCRRRLRGELVVSGRGDLSIEVQPGCAIDGSGNELILWDTQIKQVRTEGLKLPQTVYVVARYTEELTDFISYKQNLAVRGHRRVHEGAEIDVTPLLPNISRRDRDRARPPRQGRQVAHRRRRPAGAEAQRDRPALRAPRRPRRRRRRPGDAARRSPRCSPDARQSRSASCIAPAAWRRPRTRCTRRSRMSTVHAAELTDTRSALDMFGQLLFELQVAIYVEITHRAARSTQLPQHAGVGEAAAPHAEDAARAHAAPAAAPDAAHQHAAPHQRHRASDVRRRADHRRRTIARRKPDEEDRRHCRARRYRRRRLRQGAAARRQLALHRHDGDPGHAGSAAAADVRQLRDARRSRTIPSRRSSRSRAPRIATRPTSSSSATRSPTPSAVTCTAACRRAPARSRTRGDSMSGTTTIEMANPRGSGTMKMVQHTVAQRTGDCAK